MPVLVLAALGEAFRKFIHDELGERPARGRQVAAGIDQPQSDFATAGAWQHAKQPACGHVLRADRQLLAPTEN